MATIGLTLITILFTVLAVRTRTVGGLAKIGSAWIAYAIVTAMFAGII